MLESLKIIIKKRQEKNWVEKDHLGDWSPEKDCWPLLFATDVSKTCAEAIFRVLTPHDL